MKSEICLYNLQNATVETVLQTDRLVEAPNWTPDAAALIVNCEGRIFRVDLAKPGLEKIDTDFAMSCNNDHGVSPDGQTLAISDRTEDGTSCIYTLPITGGRPQRVTGVTPSYWHGWSPDGSALAFVGKREDNVFNVYTISLNGGAETRLTEGFDHSDGPDYTPDGKWIWFNGEKENRMQLWRIRPDGSALEQMTDDERCNWFPHPAPNGRWIVYLTYAPGTTGHPRDREVDLRLIPANGGTPRILIRMFGGQGTINVPSWSPDSSRFAFVRYERP